MLAGAAESSSEPGTIPAVAVLQALAAGDVRRLMETYRDALRAHQEELNRLNVYPVPDGDTGTNMALTVEAVCAELETTGGRGPDAPAMTDVCTAIAHGSLMGARGNSGVILSQILRGLAETFTPLESIDTRVLMVGLRRGADAAYEAVMRPVEGTILTAARSVAEAVEEAVDEGNVSLEGVLERAAGAARAAVEQSPRPVARARGGGRGRRGQPGLRVAPARVPARCRGSAAA